MVNDGKIHYSTLKQIEQSPAHYRWAITHERTDSPAMRQGRALHALYLLGTEPVNIAGSKRGANDSVDALAPAEYDTVRRMFDALQSSVEAREILSRCPEREMPLEWDLMGLQCAGGSIFAALEFWPISSRAAHHSHGNSFGMPSTCTTTHSCRGTT